MVTFGLIVVLVLVVAAAVAVVHQMATSPLAWVIHMAGGTPDLLGKVFVLVLEAIAEANR